MDRKSLLLLGATVFGSLLAAELSLRILTRYGSNRESFATPAASDHAAAELSDGARHISRMPAAPGTDRQWFVDDPPPLNRVPVDKRERDLFAEYQRRGVFYTARSQYLWNRFFVESANCGPSGFFSKYPPKIKVFDPPGKSVHPPFRFPPDTTMVTGMVTNQFGFRGPQIDLAKPPKTIRIAFVGASTTETGEDAAFSYPERTTYWLSRFASANHLDVRFEGINAGREGIDSEDIAAIVKHELIALDPDLVVYYEGSNEFMAGSLIVPPIPARAALDPNDVVVGHKLPTWAITHFAIGDLLDRALLGVAHVGEPRKPSYRLTWPAGVSENNPDPNNPNLPLRLPTIMKHLDNIRESLETNGGRLVMTSFKWFAPEGLMLSPVRHRYIYQQLNTTLWPLTYTDIRRVADFQNRALRAYAASRRVPFLDVASQVPQDPALFVDAIHMTEVGERVKAWVVFQQLVPFVRRQIDDGSLPRRGPQPPLPPPPSLRATEVAACDSTPSGAPFRVENDFSVTAMTPADKDAAVETGKPVKVITTPSQFGFSGSVALNLPAYLPGRTFIWIRARVLRGQVGFAVLDVDRNFQVQKTLDASDQMTGLYLPVLDPSRARSLIVTNMAPGNVRSEVLIDEATLLTDRRAAPEQLLANIGLDRITARAPDANIAYRGKEAVITTSPAQWVYSAGTPLESDAAKGPGIRIKLRVQVLKGAVGFAVLNRDEKSVAAEQIVRPTPEATEVSLQLNGAPPFGPLVVWNVAEGNVASTVMVQSVAVYR